VIIQQMRLQKGWSQQQLADISGLNVRTIQRVEQRQSVSLESFKALGAAFNVDFSELQENAVREIANTPEQTKIFLAFRRVRKIKGFYYNLISYGTVMSVLTVLNLYYTPRHIWFVFPLIGWGLGLMSHGVRVFDLLKWFGPQWERDQVEKHLGRRI
jgi:transcriptional regulator with XRE-family HTH domain